MNIFIPIWILIPGVALIGFLAFVGAGVLWVAYIGGYFPVLRGIERSRKQMRQKQRHSYSRS
ncbi:MAG TPA: hypothetical protein VHY08_08620 [Bacillota bacterium]|nr:hypothetical protein [Bacillota bacterium]